MSSHHTAPVEPLMRLSRMPDYTVERHEPDPRGWTVVNGRGTRIGEVKDLVVDTSHMTARYLDVELDTRMFDWRGDDPHVLVPVEHAHAQGKRLVVPEITEGWVTDLRHQRLLSQCEFWDGWWRRDEHQPTAGTVTHIGRVVNPEELHRAINEVRPGETVRIPVVNEEIVVERRPTIDEPAAPRR